MLEPFGVEAVSLGLIAGHNVYVRKMGAVSEDDVVSGVGVRP